MSTPPAGRTARSRDEILQAAVDLCAERGYAAVTMEAVATRAKVGKPTVYRWWPSKGALFLDALMDRLGERFFLYPDTGDIDADLRTWLRTLAEVFADERHGQIISGVIGSAQLDTELAAMIQGKVHTALAAINRARLVKAQEAGQLAAGDPALYDDMLVAPLWYRLLVTGEPITSDYADTIVNTLISPAPGQAPAAEER
ncbi:TetR/AcrR family transcriptional regulator [Amycolatopsis sp. NPDC024027]|uniref:TetR/AcrR family transcriptional regulator n=1 Tax=Amycolatopsis sp. NPDC024027 TaxID=3154327 RepID=UPI0033E2CE75